MWLLFLKLYIYVKKCIYDHEKWDKKGPNYMYT